MSAGAERRVHVNSVWPYPQPFEHLCQQHRPVWYAHFLLPARPCRSTAAFAPGNGPPPCCQLCLPLASHRAARPASNTELAEGLVVFRRVWLVLQLIQHPRVIHHFEVIELPKNVHVALRLCRLSQNRRQQNPPLSVHLNHLPEIAGPHEKLALRRVRAGHLRELVLDLSPHLQRVNQRHFTGLAGNVELIAVPFERLEKLGGDLQTTLFVHLRRRVAPQFHGFGLVGGSACPLRPLPLKRPTPYYCQPLCPTFSHRIGPISLLSSEIRVVCE